MRKTRQVMKAMASNRVSVMEVMHRMMLLATTAAMLSSCALQEPSKGSPVAKDKTSTDAQARIVPAVLRVEQRMVEGRLQFVFCVSDCNEPTPKVLHVQDFQAGLAEILAKQKTMPSAPSASDTTAMVANVEQKARVEETATASITPVESMRLQLDQDLLSWWVVYFRWASAELGVNAKAVLDRTVSVAKQSKRIIVSATADPTGDQEKNRQLVRDRVQAVKNYLVAKGVDPAKLELAVMPESANGLPSLAPTLATKGVAVPGVQGMNLPADGFAKQRRTELLIQFSK
jgi:outer membrane protein OmpA-like peptidoglycan-associated protein